MPVMITALKALRSPVRKNPLGPSPAFLQPGCLQRATTEPRKGHRSQEPVCPQKFKALAWRDERRRPHPEQNRGLQAPSCCSGLLSTQNVVLTADKQMHEVPFFRAPRMKHFTFEFYGANLSALQTRGN